MHFLINCHPILFKMQNALQNYHSQMLRNFFKLSITGSSAIQDFVKFENHELIRIGLIYYWILSTSVTNDFCSLGRPRLFWGQKLMIQKNCFILIERYKPFQNFGKKYFFLSNCILSSKWPRFVVPIHSGNAVDSHASYLTM